MFLTKQWIPTAIFALSSVTGHAHAATYSSPTVGAQYYWTNSMTGDLMVEVLSVGSDRYESKTQRLQGNSSVETRLFGILSLGKQLSEGVLPLDAQKAAQIFPLAVGRKVNFDAYGTSGGGRWYRGHTWEVIQEYSTRIGATQEKFFVIKILSESPGFLKFDGVCHYSPTFAACIYLEGDLFIRGNSAMTGRMTSSMTKAVIKGVETAVPNLMAASTQPSATTSGASPTQAAPAEPTSATQPAAPQQAARLAPPPPTHSAVPAPIPQAANQAQLAAASDMAGAPVAATSPQPAAAAQLTNAEQRLKQARDLLDKKLITLQQYDEFVSRIMKDM